MVLIFSFLNLLLSFILSNLRGHCGARMHGAEIQTRTLHGPSHPGTLFAVAHPESPCLAEPLAFSVTVFQIP